MICDRDANLSLTNACVAVVLVSVSLLQVSPVLYTRHSAFSSKHPQCNAMIKQIKNNGGNWPTSNETLVNNYLQFFVTFVKSIDFTDLQ